jgi:hypothetical protein
MDVLQRASGPEYDIGADTGESEWVTTRKARVEDERARMRGAKHSAEMLRDRSSCREFTLAGELSRCE